MDFCGLFGSSITKVRAVFAFLAHSRVHFGLRQGWLLSPIMFGIFMDRILRRSCGEEAVWFANLWVSSLLFADDVVLLGLSSHVL